MRGTNVAHMARSSSLLFAGLLTATGGFLDAYTILTRGVFATGQTGNVILLTVNLSRRQWPEMLAHLWPILAFVVGVIIASFIKSKRGHEAAFYPALLVIGVHALVLFVIGFVPESVPNAFVTVPIAFIAAVQISMYRQVGSLAYIPIATTGNLTRLIEGAYAGLVDGDSEQRANTHVYLIIVGSFVGGAALGGLTTYFMHVKAAWIPMLLILGTLAMAILDERDARRATDAPVS